MAHCRQCPSCKVACIKEGGCDHVICTLCGEPSRSFPVRQACYFLCAALVWSAPDRTSLTLRTLRLQLLLAVRTQAGCLSWGRVRMCPFQAQALLRRHRARYSRVPCHTSAPASNLPSNANSADSLALLTSNHAPQSRTLYHLPRTPPLHPLLTSTHACAVILWDAAHPVLHVAVYSVSACSSLASIYFASRILSAAASDTLYRLWSFFSASLAIPLQDRKLEVRPMHVVLACLPAPSEAPSPCRPTCNRT